MTKRTIAVIGATSGTGRPLVSALLEKGLGVRAITRRADASALLPAEVEIRSGDLEDAGSLAAAFASASAIHYIPPSFDPREPGFARNIIDAAARAGLSRIVYHSVLHPGTPEMPHHLRKSQTEHLLRHSSLRWTIIQPAMYAQTALAFFDAEAGQLIPAFDPAKPFAPIHEGDLAEAAAIIHGEDGHVFATYELAGSEVLDFMAMADRLATVLGRPVTTRRVSAATLVPRVAAARGYTAEQARELELMLDHYDGYGLVGNGNVLRMILGREPTSFADAMRHSLSAGKEAVA